ncbi:MAG: MoxR family ATPase [Saprospiraceae bacterium]|nr:MoxR family ATPase [Saprospiraceae bacterium]
MKFNIYQTEGEAAALPDFKPLTNRRDDAATYLPSDELVAAVNVALALGRPLLLTGEPGTGKTMLAWHIARRFSNLEEEPLVFEVQTTSTKKDLFYHYDALGHFRWAQKEEAGEAADIEDRFIRYEGLGRAIQMAQKEDRRSIVLIDEIDKAPRDLPNDLLAAIENLRFDVPEVPVKPKREYQCPDHLRPVIIITSNSEKNLPEAFLRRVVYHHIEFPDSKKLLDILQAKGILFAKDDDPEAIVAHFEAIRSKGLNKRPATAELVAWATLLPQIGFPTHKLRQPEKLTEAERKLLHQSYSVLAKMEDDLKKLKLG